MPPSPLKLKFVGYSNSTFCFSFSFALGFHLGFPSPRTLRSFGPFEIFLDLPPLTPPLVTKL